MLRLIRRISWRIADRPNSFSIGTGWPTISNDKAPDPGLTIRPSLPVSKLRCLDPRMGIWLSRS